MKTTHRHRPVSRLTRTVGWVHCVAKPTSGCSGAAHGGVTHIETCKCGATRHTETNGRHSETGAWKP
jgi:hypothetical protein